MAVRRLLIVMLILLGISTLLASQVPDDSILEDTGATQSTTVETPETPSVPTQAAPGDAAPAGRLLEPICISVVDPRIKVVPIAVGDQLPLVVRSRRGDQVEIPALGLVEPVSDGAPARFDILAREPGSFGIRLTRADRVIGRIEVTDRPAAEEPPERAEKDSGTC